MQTLPSAFDVLDFWWRSGPTRWFVQDDTFDREVRETFGQLHEAAAGGQFTEWDETPHGALARIIVLDQFSRNIYRGDARAFAQDEAALAAAEAALEKGFDRAYPVPARNFYYMPFMHAEDLAAQERCTDLFRVLGDRDSYFYALVHLDAIRRFGRFPHRNPVVGRDTTEEERRYLDTGGFGG